MDWFAHPENTKPLGLLIFFVTFCAIVLWVYGSRKRSEKLEEHKNIPFLDDEDKVKDKSNG
jgi:cbb3-type cytochrome oxidase subunit 3